MTATRSRRANFGQILRRFDLRLVTAMLQSRARLAARFAGPRRRHRPEPMPNVTSVIARTMRKRLDWNMIGIAVSVLIVTIAGVILVRLLRDIDVDKVVVALQAKSVQQISIAGVFV